VVCCRKLGRNKLGVAKATTQGNEGGSKKLGKEGGTWVPSGRRLPKPGQGATRGIEKMWRKSGTGGGREEKTGGQEGWRQDERVDWKKTPSTTSWRNRRRMGSAPSYYTDIGLGPKKKTGV